MRFLCGLLALSFLVACGGEVAYSPKPRCFPRLDFPEKTYQTFNVDYCDFSFEYPTYAKVEKDSSFFGEDTKDECWFDLVVPALNGRIHFSYYPIETDTSFEKFRSDAFRLADEHTVRADFIDNYPLKKPNGVSGFIFDIEGPTASPFQFYLTDSTDHFLRGSLYINAQSRPDSLKPIVDFLKVDAVHLMNTFEFR